MRAFLDSGGFLALLDQGDRHHPQARDLLDRLRVRGARLFSSNYVVDETCTLVRFRKDHAHAVRFLQELDRSPVRLLRVTAAVEEAAKRIFMRYADKDFSFTDCTSFGLIDAHRLDAILAFDEHFTQYRFRHYVLHLTSPEQLP